MMRSPMCCTPSQWLVWFRRAQPKLFDFMFRLRDKHAVSKIIYPLRKDPVVHVSSMYSGQQSNLSVVMPLCAHPDNRNGVLCYDLRVDPASFTTLSAEEIRDRIFTPRIDLEANGWIRLPIKTVHLNRCPALSPLTTLRRHDAERIGLDLDQIAAHATQLQSDTADALATSVQLAFSPREFDPVTDPDRMLYGGGFFSDGDRAKMQELRGMDPMTLAAGTPPLTTLACRKWCSVTAHATSRRHSLLRIGRVGMTIGTTSSVLMTDCRTRLPTRSIVFRMLQTKHSRSSRIPQDAGGLAQ